MTVRQADPRAILRGLFEQAPALRQATQSAIGDNAELDTTRYQSAEGIVDFVKEILNVKNIAPYQEEILRAVWNHHRVSVRGPHGLGKTALSAWVILWGITVFPDDVKIPTTASNLNQLYKFLWPEVRKWARRGHWHKLGLQLRAGKEVLDNAIRLTGKEAFALASKDASAIEGAHAKVLIYVFDEAKAIPDETFDAAEGAFSTAGDDTDDMAFALAISTPGAKEGKFYNIHARKPGLEKWWVRHVTLEEAIAAGRISKQWAKDRASEWGEDDPRYINRVLGNFADSAEDAIIPLSWVEKSNQRWHDWHDAPPPPEDDEWWVTPEVLGVDIARYGSDKSALARRHGNVVTGLQYHAKRDLMTLVGFVALEAAGDYGLQINADTIGLGAGVYDRLVEQGYHNALSVNVGEGTDWSDKADRRFLNLRAALMFRLKDALDPDGDERLALPPDERLTSDLTTPRWKPTSTGKIKVESKEEIKKRLRRSPDAGDAVMLTYAHELADQPWSDVW